MSTVSARSEPQPIPAFFLVVFAVIEPLLLVYVGLWALSDPAAYHESLVPAPFLKFDNDTAPVTQAHAQSLMMSRLTGNGYLLLAGLGVVLVTLMRARKDRGLFAAYLGVLALGDIGHIAATLSILGEDRVQRFTEWNDMTKGNVWGTLGLLLCRLTWLAFYGTSRNAKAKMA